MITKNGGRLKRNRGTIKKKRGNGPKKSAISKNERTILQTNSIRKRRRKTKKALSR
jgi:hypothetical protein